MNGPDENEFAQNPVKNEVKLAQGEAQWREDRTGFHWNKKTIYHGTNTSGIVTFEFAGESTIGNNAVYFTSDRSLANGYAQLRRRENGAGTAIVYEAVVEDIDLMNWVEKKVVDVLKQKFMAYCVSLESELEASDFETFASQHMLEPQITKRLVQLALRRIIEHCEGDVIHGGNIKLIAQGVMGIFFQEFVKISGFNGVITIEGGDDPKFTAKPGISVVVYDRDKITSLSEKVVSDETDEQ